MKQRQKMIRIADKSDMGWKVVDEYIQSDVACYEEDQKRIHIAQSRAERKVKSNRGTRVRRPFPYRTRFIPKIGTPVTATITQPSQQLQQQQRRLVSYFLFGESGKRKFECPNVKHNVKLSIKNSFSCLDQIEISDIKPLE